MPINSQPGSANARAGTRPIVNFDRGGFTRIPNSAIISLRDAKGSEEHVYCELSMLASPGSSISISVPAFARSIGLHKSNAYKAIDGLALRGLVEISKAQSDDWHITILEPPATVGTAAHAQRLASLFPEKPPSAGVVKSQLKDGESSEIATQESRNSNGQVVKSQLYINQEDQEQPRSELDTTVAKSQLADGGDRRAFPDRIYQAYPRHVAKDDALKAIVKAIKKLRADPPPQMNGTPAEEWLLRQTKQYADQRNEITARDPIAQQFTPYPSTWFNRGSYLDEENAAAFTTKHPNGSRYVQKENVPGRYPDHQLPPTVRPIGASTAPPKAEQR